MKYSDFGLVNTREMFVDAIARKYAVPAFNFYNMETLTAILVAARKMHSPVILAASESAIKYMGDDMLLGLITGACITPTERIALHLDHGHSLDACIHAIELGFSSVMIDASNLPFDENIKLSRAVAKYAHPNLVCFPESKMKILRPPIRHTPPPMPHWNLSSQPVLIHWRLPLAPAMGSINVNLRTKNCDLIYCVKLKKNYQIFHWFYMAHQVFTQNFWK